MLYLSFQSYKFPLAIHNFSYFGFFQERPSLLYVGILPSHISLINGILYRRIRRMDDTIGSVVTANPEGTRPRGKSPIWISSIEKLRNTCNMEAIDCRGNGLSTVLKVTAYTVSKYTATCLTNIHVCANISMFV